MDAWMYTICILFFPSTLAYIIVKHTPREINRIHLIHQHLPHRSGVIKSNLAMRAELGFSFGANEQDLPDGGRRGERADLDELIHQWGGKEIESGGHRSRLR